jgi:DNA protecting protein DprA
MHRPAAHNQLGVLVALSWLPGVGAATLRKAARHEALASMQPQELGEIDPRIARALLPPGAWDAARRSADECMELAREHDAQMLVYGSPGYPELLARSPDAPFFLYVKGTLPQASTLAVIGTRYPTRLGRVVATKIAGHFAEQDVSIISGLAYGVDAAGHEAALAAGGHTVAVLGHGLQTIYPKQNAELADQILVRGGALVSEYHFGTPLVPRRLFERDLIQAGLSQAVVMVQSKHDGGSMHTAKAALRYGRRLYVPAPLPEDLAGTDSAVEVPRMLLQASQAEIAELFRCDAQGLSEIELLRSRDDYARVTAFLGGQSMEPDLLCGPSP